MRWIVETLNKTVDAELERLPADQKAMFLRIAELIENHGLDRVHGPYVRHIRGKLWEMRMRGRDGISRALYVAVAGRRVVVVRVFQKKSQKTPRSEIELALARARTIA